GRRAGASLRQPGGARLCRRSGPGVSPVRRALRGADAPRALWRGIRCVLSPRPPLDPALALRERARRVRMKEFKGRVAVVTGAASGIGLALAERFAAEGMKVALADVEEGALRTAERALKAKGASALAVPTDVTRADDVDALAKKTLDAFGAVHVVCNNAGVGGDFRLSWQQTLENWQWVLGVNLW